ncbi:hypothetical protein [Clostridium uliginosum]|uniref:HNH endonuclease n=1 Tax=Clostridium uliginosum TaxID=119641 RepID=A0A1I1GU19_9CLOT|nr:hypothetical protein [Clostridium uliginosum]SFC14802.1 hypothetical protein SAMN05421842_10154 [Clostridium uliginosum]
MGKVSCSVCGRIHERNYICNAKKQRQLDKSKRDRERLDSKIYSTSRWRKLRNNVIEDYNNIDLFAYYIESRVEVAQTVHHIIEVMENIDLAYDTDNLIPLSNYTHRRIVHKLYKTKCKNYIVMMLNDMLDDWNKGNKELGSYKERYNKIVKEFE